VPGCSSSTVSVVIPTQGTGRGLSRAVASVLRQVEVRVRLIVVVDGTPVSPEDRELLHSLEAPHRVVHMPHVGHVAVLRNLALNLVRTELVAFLDDDDWWMDSKLCLQVMALRTSGSVLVGSNALRVVSTEARTPYHKELPKSIGLKQLLRTNWLITSSVVADAAVLRSVGGFPVDDSLRHGLEDYGAWLRVASVGRLRVMSEPLVYYTADNPDSLSRNALSGEEARRRVLRDFSEWSVCTRQSLRRRDRALLSDLTGTIPVDPR
jgi:glycosyltransferase involved in cell wall biosynthesis